MELYYGGGSKMIGELNIQLPDKIFGLETNLLKLLIVPILLVVILLGTGVAVLVPKIGEIGDNINEVDVLKQELNALIRQKDFFDSLDVNQMKNNSKLIQSAVMGENNAYLLVGLIRELAGKYNFQVDSFNVSPGEAFDNESLSSSMGIVKLSTQVSLIGPKGKYFDLIKGIESSLPILEIGSFEANEGELSVSLDMGINSFYIGRKEKQILDKLSIGDLEMTKDEKLVLDKISDYSYIVEQSQSTDEVAKKEFVKYNKSNPFSDSTVISIPTP